MTTRRFPLISVGMAVYNCEKTLKMAVRSIMGQTYRNWELLIIDDGSTDSTVEIAQNFDDSRIRVIVGGSRLGISARLNQPISLAKGEYFARMDGDDVAYPERFERQLRYLEEHPEVDLLGAGILVFKGNGRAMGTRKIPQTHDEICRRPWSGFYLPHSTWMARTAWFRKHPYRSEARIGDADMMQCTYRSNRFASLPEILVGYRENSFSLRKALKERWYFVIELTRKSLLGGDSTWFACRGVPEHILKAMVEVIAFAAGQPYRVLRHRALPASPEILQRWTTVWAHLQGLVDETTAASEQSGGRTTKNRVKQCQPRMTDRA